jgi:hypothetical protein
MEPDRHSAGCGRRRYRLCQFRHGQRVPSTKVPCSRRGAVRNAPIAAQCQVFTNGFLDAFYLTLDQA